MLEIIFSVLAVWLFIKAVGLTFKLAWSAAKVAATILLVIAVPVFILAIFVGGFVLLLPVALIAAAVGLLKACT